jgi:hypothetical protein
MDLNIGVITWNWGEGKLTEPEFKKNPHHFFKDLD